MPRRSVRRNRVVLVALTLAVSGVAVYASVRAMESPRPGMLLAATAALEQSPARPAPLASDGGGPRTPFTEVAPIEPLTDLDLDADHDDAGADDLDVEIIELDLAPTDDPADIRWFDGRPIRPVKSIRMRVTAYSPDARSCGRHADGITASGYSVWTNGMKMVAADTRLLPFGSLVSVPGYDGGQVVPVLDRGGKIKGNRLDVLYATHAAARRWGTQWLDVVVWGYADGKPSGFRTSHRR